MLEPVGAPHDSAHATADAARDGLDVVHLVDVGGPQQHPSLGVCTVVGTGQRDAAPGTSGEAPGYAVAQALRVTALARAPTLSGEGPGTEAGSKQATSFAGLIADERFRVPVGITGAVTLNGRRPRHDPRAGKVESGEPSPVVVEAQRARACQDCHADRQ